MTAAYLPSLEPATVKREKIRRRVRPTSIAQYGEGRERFTGRKAEVLRWLAAYYNRYQESPTSAELAQIHPDFIAEIAVVDQTPWGNRQPPNFDGTLTLLLYVRRGLSDLQTSGIVKANGPRKCRVTGRKCETWRVVEVGRT
jgi:hypothetical protein